MSRVLVLGATGTLGPHVVHALRGKADHVRVLTRNGETAKAHLPADVEVAVGDFRDDATMREATAGVDAMLLLTPHAVDMADDQLHVIRRLRRSGIRIVKISGTSSAIQPDGPDACRQHWEVEQILAQSDQPFVILRPNAFMQTVLGQITPIAVGSTGMVPDALAGAGISFIDCSDIADVAAECLVDAKHEGETYVLTGPRPVSFIEVAKMISQGTGREIGIAELTPADVKRSFLERGVEEWEAEHFEEMYEMFRRHESEFVSEHVRTVAGHQPRTVEDYIAANIDLFHPASVTA